MPRLPTVTIDRCVSQALTLRAAAATSADPAERARLTHMAEAYETLHARSRDVSLRKVVY